MMFKSQGKIILNPKATGIESRGLWIIALCQESISEYYRYLVLKNDTYVDDFFGTAAKIRNPKLTRSAWGTHISIVRNEKANEKVKELSGESIKFNYFPERLSNNNKHWWIPIESEDIENIREYIGLERKYQYYCWGSKCGNPSCEKKQEDYMVKKHDLQLHMTIGHRANWR